MSTSTSPTVAPPLAGESLLTMAEAARFYGSRSGFRPHPSTVFRHARRGVAAAQGGGRIRLEHVRVGGRIFTSRESIERFWAACADADAANFASTN